MTLKQLGVADLSRDEEDLEIAEDPQLLEAELERPKYRPGYIQFLKSPQHDLELFLDQLDSERRSRGI